VIEPLDDDERRRLLAELIVERFGKSPKRAPTTDESPHVIARRRRVLCGLDQPREAA
jgi:hypothetical protein